MPQSEKESKKIETTRRLITATPPDIQIESSVKQAIPENKQSESKPIHKIYQEPEYVEDDEDDEECVYSKDDPEEFIFSLPSEEFDAIMKAAVKREHSIEIEQETFDYLCAEAEWREMSGPGAVVDWLIAKEIEEQIATAEWGMREPETK